jgi:hypothetical protein
MIRSCDRCDRKHYARGLCRSHYLQARDAGYFEIRYQPSLFPLTPALERSGLTVPGFTRQHGISGTRFAVWQAKGLTTFEADRVAVRMGITPETIWPDWFVVAADEVLAEDFDAPLILETA